jgi:hypothetical protein
MGRSRFVCYLSIFANLVFVVFLGLLIHNQVRTLRWVHGVNQFWFPLVLVAIIVLAAVWTELSARSGKQKTNTKEARSQGADKSAVRQADPTPAP